MLYVDAFAAATVSAASLLATGSVGIGLRTIGIARFTGCRGCRPRVRSEERETESRRTPAAATEAEAEVGAGRVAGASTAVGREVGSVWRWPATTATIATMARARQTPTHPGARAARFITDDEDKTDFLRRRASRGRTAAVTTHPEVRSWQDCAGGR